MTKRRSFLQKASLLFLGLIGLTSKSEAKPEEGKAKVIKGTFMHVVFFWLKEPDNEEARAKFMAELTQFIDNTPVIKMKHIGTPADTDRPVIDSTYTYSLILSFKTKKEHDIYQEHPLHKTFIANAEDLWEKVLVYDSVLS